MAHLHTVKSEKKAKAICILNGLESAIVYQNMRLMIGSNTSSARVSFLTHIGRCVFSRLREGVSSKKDLGFLLFKIMGNLQTHLVAIAVHHSPLQQLLLLWR